MRLRLIAPADLNPEQRPVYEDMRTGIEKNFQGFSTIAKGGALMGPWNPWLHEPKFGKPIWELTKALSFSPSPKPVREVAILVTGAKFRAAYEIYAHVMLAERRGLSDEKLATIVAGQRPNDLARDEAIAYDVASALVGHGVLPELTYRQAVQAFGVTTITTHITSDELRRIRRGREGMRSGWSRAGSWTVGRSQRAMSLATSPCARSARSFARGGPARWVRTCRLTRLMRCASSARGSRRTRTCRSSRCARRLTVTRFANC